jgi:AmmeMemoRadiSam system protein A
MVRCQIPKLDEHQKNTILQATAILISRAIRRHTLSSPDLGDMQNWQVDGVFVSLHKGKELRSCCGMISGPHALPTCLERAAWRAACDDPRFTPVSSQEMPELRLDIHLLHRWQPCEVATHSRAQAVSVGRHGLMVRQGPAAGLLLPAVGREQGWDSVTFLQQACAKAGIASNAWQASDCELDLFEAWEIGSAMKLFLP